MRRLLYSRRLKRRSGVEINLAPLMDMVFILLIFFLVTTSFSRESGITVKRPKAKTAQSLDSSSFMVGISKSGDVFIEGKRVDIRMVRSMVAKALRENPKTGVVIVCDRDAKTDTLIRVLDECRRAGTRNVSIAARRVHGRGD